MNRRRYLRALGPLLLLAIGGAYAIASWNWCGRWDVAPASLLATGAAQGSLRAGAARVEIKVPFPIVAAGYGPPRPEVGDARPALEARAVVLEVSPVKVAIVELDLLTAPADLVEKIRADVAGLGISQVLVVASHAHSSMGAYDPRLVSEIAGTGGFRQDAFDAVVAAADDALRAAHGALAPAALRIGKGDASSLVRARSGTEVDTQFTRIVIEPVSAGTQVQGAGGEAADGRIDAGPATGDGAQATVAMRGTEHADAGAVKRAQRDADAGSPTPGDGRDGNAPPIAVSPDAGTPPAAPSASGTGAAAIAELWILSAHPTLVERKPAHLSPDYPGLVDGNDGPVTLVLQSAIGNASAVEPEGKEGTPESRFADAVTSFAHGVSLGETAPETYLAYSRVSFGVPRPDGSRLAPSFARAASDNLMCSSASPTAELSALRIDDQVFVALPGEPSQAASKELLEKTGASRVLALTNGYLGYVEPAEVVKAGGGESKRQYFGAGLLGAIDDAAALAVTAVRPIAR